LGYSLPEFQLPAVGFDHPGRLQWVEAAATALLADVRSGSAFVVWTLAMIVRFQPTADIEG
jgi:hypothetical protein